MTIGQACFKRPGRVVANTLILVNSLGSCIVSLVIFATVAQNIMGTFTSSCSAEGHAKFYCSTTMLTIIAGLIILPMNFIKSFNRMRFVSVLKIASIIIFTAITIGFAFVRAVQGEVASTVAIWPNFSEPLAMLATVPQIMVGYDFLFNQFSLYKTMNETSDKKFKKAVFTSMTFVGFVYLSVGICGHLIYGNQTNDLLKNFNQRDLGTVWYSVLNLAFLVSSLAGIPVSYVPARTIVYQGIVKRMIEKRLTNLKQENKETFCSASDFVPSTHNRTVVYTAVVLVTTIIMVILAIVVPGLNQALGLIGSVGSTGLVFVLPMSFYLILASRKRKYKKLCKFVLVFGIISGIFGLVINTVSIISPDTIKM